MDLAALTIFRAVVRENGVTRAAAKLNRVQSNVTMRIKQLEQQFGAVPTLMIWRRGHDSAALGALREALIAEGEGCGPGESALSLQAS